MSPTIRRLWQHLFWADARLVAALVEGRAPPDALREAAHVIGTEENWLARIEQRAPLAPIWPELAPDELRGMAERTHATLREFLDAVDDGALERKVTYINSAGQRFTNSVADILVHVALHGQYHRGKINLLLRRGGRDPEPTDYIAFVRGVPAATDAGPRLP